MDRWLWEETKKEATELQLISNPPYVNMSEGDCIGLFISSSENEARNQKCNTEAPFICKEMYKTRFPTDFMVNEEEKTALRPEYITNENDMTELPQKFGYPPETPEKSTSPNHGNHSIESNERTKITVPTSFPSETAEKSTLPNHGNHSIESNETAKITLPTSYPPDKAEKLTLPNHGNYSIESIETAKVTVPTNSKGVSDTTQASVHQAAIGDGSSTAVTYAYSNINKIPGLSPYQTKETSRTHLVAFLTTPDKENLDFKKTSSDPESDQYNRLSGSGATSEHLINGKQQGSSTFRPELSEKFSKNTSSELHDANSLSETSHTHSVLSARTASHNPDTSSRKSFLYTTLTTASLETTDEPLSQISNTGVKLLPTFDQSQGEQPTTRSNENTHTSVTILFTPGTDFPEVSMDVLLLVVFIAVSVAILIFLCCQCKYTMVILRLLTKDQSNKGEVVKREDRPSSNVGR
ncbi:unnamed protein product [Lymnaea stagnalis]|uniref:Uncharacterized protein n=1 Tax=Lymnaea stagnalis TaxID=6523 RepID=A0AAV2HAU7_LYMST